MKHILLFVLPFFLIQPAVAQIPDSNEIVFEILRDGSSFGSHSVKFEQDGDKTRVLVDIEMIFRLGPIVAFRYEHSNEEIWQGDKILSMTSQTNDDGDDYAVEAVWGDVVNVDVIVNGVEELYEAPKSLFTTSYWNMESLKATQLLNTQKGRVEDVVVTRVGEEELTVDGETVTAEKYAIDASVPLEIWYDVETKQWVGLKFEVRGSEMMYRRLTQL